MKKTISFVTLLSVIFISFTAQAYDKVVVVPLGGSGVRIETKTFTKNIPATEFRPDLKSPGAELGYSYKAGIAYKITNNSLVGSSGLSASLDLPDAAKLLGVTCYIQDNDPEYNARDNSSVKISRREFTSTTKVDIISPIYMTTSGQSEVVTPFSSSSIIHPIIDTDAYFYTIRYFFQITDNANGFPEGPFSAEINFYGCSISYSLDVPTK